MARPPNQIPFGGTGGGSQLRPDTTVPEPPCVPDPPAEFDTVCPTTGIAWSPEDWRPILDVDFSGLDFSGCANEADCLQSLAAYPWAGLNWVSTSPTGQNACRIDAFTEWDDMHQPNWSASVTYVRLNGPPVNDIRLAFSSDTGQTPIVGLPAIWFTDNSNDQFSSQDTPGYDTASPPFGFFPVTWTQEVRCGTNTCPQGVAQFTMSFVPIGGECPEPFDPCDNMGALCKERGIFPEPPYIPDVPDWCWTKRLPDGTCPPIPGDADRMIFEPFLAVDDISEFGITRGRKYWLSQVLPGGIGSRVIARPFLAEDTTPFAESGRRYWSYASSCGECDCSEDCITVPPSYLGQCANRVCCQKNGRQVVMTQAQCDSVGGNAVGGNCGNLLPESEQVGACCLATGCTVTTEQSCNLANGTYLGDGVGCSGVVC